MPPLKRRHPDQPLVAVAGVVLKNESVLLVKRVHPPSQGEWSIPGGLVELGERLTDALRREIIEETGVTVEVGPLIEVIERLVEDDQGRLAYHYVILDYLCRAKKGSPAPSSDASEARWVALGDLDLLGLAAKTKEVILEADRLRRVQAGS